MEFFLGLLIGVLLTSTVFFVVLTCRKRKVKRLSNLLRQTSENNFSLDLRDYQEGELSILADELHKITARLASQTEYLQADKERLADALADVSHQFKTPLTSMLMYADLLCDSDVLAEKAREFHLVMRSQLERLQWLTGSLLKLSRIDAGTAEFDNVLFSPLEALRDAADGLAVPEGVDFSISGNEEITISGDYNWTVEAFSNILKNAFEHTLEGQITATVSDNPLYVEVIIVDTGEGIAPEDLRNVFKRFYRTKNAKPDSVGIGLPLSRAIVENMNGRIEVQSTPGQGTEFHVKYYKNVR